MYIYAHASDLCAQQMQLIIIFN